VKSHYEILSIIRFSSDFLRIYTKNYNFMSNSNLIILGFLIIAATFFISEMALNPQQKGQIALGNWLCESGLGTLGKAASSDVADKCRLLEIAQNIINFGYPIGIVIILVGVFVGGPTIIINEVVREPSPEVSPRIDSGNLEQKDESESKLKVEETDPSKVTEIIYCNTCGKLLRPNNKFCTSCGEKVTRK